MKSWQRRNGKEKRIKHIWDIKIKYRQRIPTQDFDVNQIPKIPQTFALPIKSLLFYYLLFVLIWFHLQKDPTLNHLWGLRNLNLSSIIFGVWENFNEYRNMHSSRIKSMHLVQLWIIYFELSLSTWAKFLNYSR